ncbi:hypothetical protein O0L34_g5085 [Tuta absoluta]|nr:hypothetical protein O0L34_g5085 [Tuta absoluta]
MAGQNPGSPTDFQYFYEDEVYKINNRGQVVFGLVLENYEANSSDQESDIETPIQKGEIRVVWHPSGTERVISEKSVGLADRSLMPGDVVRRLIAGKDTQRGYCRDIVMEAALQVVGTKHVLPSVASERLQPLEDFTPDLAVCLDSWVGTSKAVHSKLRLVSADGSRLEYPDLDSCPLEDYSMRRRRSAPYSSSEFYPGQVVYGPLGSLDNANWLHVTKEMKSARKHKMHDHKFTVEAVVTESVSVHWQCRALCTHPADQGTPQQPKFLVEGEDLKNLKLLNVFEPCTLQVGDRNFLTIGPEDTFVSKKQWRKHQSKYHRNLRKQSKPVKKASKADMTSEHVPSRPKKRAGSHRKLKSHDNDMEVDGEEKMEDEEHQQGKGETSCPSIKIEHSGDVGLPMASSQEDTVTEEKNDSGISPEPNREEVGLLNGDSKSDAALNDDDSDNWENTSSDGSDTDSGATWSSRCSSAASGRGKRSPQLAVRLLRGKRLKRTVRRAPPAPPPRPADRVVVETLHTASRANVVWQDGTIEMGIPSTQLYPIHHLDGQECFPGDFVVSGAANVEDQQLKHREYGVVQRVDHHGRTAIVHWYRTYTSAENPVPQMLYESEMSVYDLKDHPDFQYRPGTVVIRVANFTGEDAHCTAGQVIDNFPAGRVKVWWVDGHTSMCWPQDLYKVGEYDSEDGELWGSEGSASDDSWETQSSAHDAEPPTPTDQPPKPTAQLAIATAEHAEVDVEMPENALAGGESSSVPRLLEPRVAAHIERGRVAMRRLEEMFAKHPTLQSQEVSRALAAAPRLLEPRVAAHIERGRVAMRRLEEMFAKHPTLQSQEVSRALAAEPRLMEPRVAAHIERGRVAMRRLEEMFAKHPTLQSQEVSRALAAEPRLMEPRVAAHIERGRVAMRRLEEMFAKHPTLQSQEIMRKLLNLYKDCRFLDRLMGTSFFHEDHFLGLLERVRERGASTPRAGERRVHEQLARLFSQEPECELPPADDHTGIDDTKPIITVEMMQVEQMVKNNKPVFGLNVNFQPELPSISDTGLAKEPAAETTDARGSCASAVCAEEPEGASRNVCYKLCALIHAQLVKAHAEVSRRRPQELAEFLNSLLKKSTEDKLPYIFTVQYGALVVSMAEEDKPAEAKDEAAKSDTSATTVETAPLATGEGELEPEETPEPVVGGSEAVEGGEGFCVIESAPVGHRFRLSMLQPSEPRSFYSAVKREIKLLKSDLPPGVSVSCPCCSPASRAASTPP